jgi:phosphoadenosine phosphosulfate reductase
MSTDITLSPPSPTVETAMSQATLRHLAADAAERLATSTAEEILGWAAATFGGRFCVTSSMSDGVLAHLASRVMPGVDVLFLDTGYHFVETLGTRDAVDATLPVNVVTLAPAISVRQQDERLGPDLWSRDPDLCCALRKVQPLVTGLSSYDAWATGVRREQGGEREETPVVRYDAGHGKVVVAPLARWTQVDIDAYVAEHHVVVNPLRFDGYSSIGCWPCTKRATPGADARSGRWPGSVKTECGIHS